ncbi:MAG: hypothetical protein HKP43_02040 [Altererythrobacter sp.]|nr:hypothetical protein [Altererythrobacter sp.]NNE49330.1 hypothetical protein [Altererythrobacter sp.]NNK45390.1 hypothetical protein [Altererythrobacter sp.]
MDDSVGVTSQKRGLRAKRVGLAIAALVGILGLAWFDGGEEALHPISQEIAIPELAEQ